MSRLQQLQNMLAAQPASPFLLFALAKEYEKLGDYAEALRYFERLEADFVDYVGTYYHLGKLLERLQQPARAFASYKKGMRIAQAQGDTHSYSELAGAKLNLGDEDDF